MEPGHGCSEPVGDHQHLHRKVKHLQLPQKVQCLLSLLKDEADVLLPLKLMGDGGGAPGMMGGRGTRSFLKSISSPSSAEHSAPGYFYRSVSANCRGSSRSVVDFYT